MSEITDIKQEGLKIRFAVEDDVPLILDFIKELAAYEKLLDKVVATGELLREFLFQRKVAEGIIGEYEGKPAGYALFFYNFSSFLGRPGLYVEDIYIKPEYRGMGWGRSLFTFLAQLALERGCGRLEFSCLNWNEPSIRFYKHLGAFPLEEWTTYRICGQAMEDLGKGMEFRKKSNGYYVPFCTEKRK